MQELVVYEDVDDVERRLRELGLDRSSLIQVAKQAFMNRNESVAADPINAPGQLSYIFGVRELRLQLLPKGWEIDREDNIEGTINPGTGIKIVFQNADLACDAKDPKAISDKGPANQKLVERSASYHLFEEDEMAEQAAIEISLLKNKCSVWYYFVSYKDDEVRAEISRPAAILGGQFTNFQERIFVLNGDEKDSEFASTSSDDSLDKEVVINITRK